MSTVEQDETARTELAELAETDRVAGRLYTDPAIFDLEMEKIFRTTWVWVAHESEIPDKGSFKTTSVGDQPVIITRDRKGNVNTLLNRCRHRGSTVCDQSRGKANGFTCPYHNWSYALDGRLRGIPYPDGYEGIIDKADFPLQKLRTESYLGMIWATFNEDAQPLEDFLGDAKIWMERFFKQSNGYPTKITGVHKFRFKGNWKIQLENTTDGYHFPMVHKSWMASVDAETADMMSFMSDPEAVTHDVGNGHSVAIMAPGNADLDIDDGAPLQSRFDDTVQELRDSGEYSEEQIRRFVRSIHGAGFNLNTFPNVSMSISFLRVLIPISVDETEIWHMSLGMDDGPECVNRERLRIHEHFQGPFGFGSPDDSEGWERVQVGAVGNPEMPIMVNRGLNRETTSDEGWPTSHVTDETGMRGAYAMWKKMMSE
ncbi:aromatic ring-hydroxylating oxygenase subunit alpha [Janibacter sp. GS2]|uniref:aromatic ring-hydroxylating oxygenase subunit alpha n=1 Tax=Janibacter sp. GS2 TaxID=3442646 RepID=UPI003EB78B58